VKSLGLLTVIPLIGACRLGFDAVPDDPADAAVDAPPTVLACNTQPAFRLGSTPRKVAATAWRDGYLVVTADAAGKVRGSFYKFVAGTLVADQQDVGLADGMSDVGSVGTLALGDRMLLVVPHDSSTQLITVDRALAPQPAEDHPSWLGGAATAATNSAGQVAFIAQHATSGEIGAFLVGGDPAPLVIAQAGEQAVSPSIMPAGANFLVVWDVVGPNHRIARAELVAPVGGKLAVVHGATRLNTDDLFDAENPRGAYLAGADRYLTAWMKKTNGDEIWASLRKPDLTADGPDFLLGAQGNEPRVNAGSDDFLVAWKAADKLYATRVTTGGSTAIDVPTAGGTVTDWDVVTRAGQTALVWVEADGGGAAMVKFDPLCH
jgi:hypothetical protein